MNLVKHLSIASLTALTIGAIFPTASKAANFTVFSGSGANAATAFEDMKSAIGGVNNGTTPGSQGSGFRTINWDGVKLDGTDIDPDTIGDKLRQNLICQAWVNQSSLSSKSLASIGIWDFY